MISNRSIPSGANYWITRRGRSTCGLIGLLAVALWGTGCGSSGPYGCARVKGSVHYEDGSIIPTHRIEIRFISQEAPRDGKTHPRPGLAEVNTQDGTFTDVSTYKFGDGAIKGRHKVVITSMNEQNGITPAIPSLFHSVETTPLEVSTDDAPFEFKIPKP